MRLLTRRQWATDRIVTSGTTSSHGKVVPSSTTAHVKGADTSIMAACPNAPGFFLHACGDPAIALEGYFLDIGFSFSGSTPFWRIENMPLFEQSRDTFVAYLPYQLQKGAEMWARSSSNRNNATAGTHDTFVHALIPEEKSGVGCCGFQRSTTLGATLGTTRGTQVSVGTPPAFGSWVDFGSCAHPVYYIVIATLLLGDNTWTNTRNWWQIAKADSAPTDDTRTIVDRAFNIQHDREGQAPSWQGYPCHVPASKKFWVRGAGEDATESSMDVILICFG